MPELKQFAEVTEHLAAVVNDASRWLFITDEQHVHEQIQGYLLRLIAMGVIRDDDLAYGTLDTHCPARAARRTFSWVTAPKHVRVRSFLERFGVVAAPGTMIFPLCRDGLLAVQTLEAIAARDAKPATATAWN